MIRLAPVLAVLAVPALAEDGVSLGPGFDGAWATDGMTCDDLGRVEIGEGVMVGAEFAITVTDIVEFPGEPNRVEATLLNEAGGGSWTDSAVLTLSDDGQELRFAYPDGSVAVWSRCE